MALFKDKANQKVLVFAWDMTANDEKTGDADNITAQISKDGGACSATTDVNPTELDATDAPGIYIFNLTKDETDCDLFLLFAKSSTGSIKIEPVVSYPSLMLDIKDRTDTIGGAGAVSWTYTLTNATDGSPIPDTDIWITTDVEGKDIIATGKTNQLGQALFYLDTGTVYVWRQKSGWNFTNPDTEVVS